MAIVAGVLRLTASFAPSLLPPLTADLLYIATDLAIIVGLIGIYLGQYARLGQLGLSGFLIALLGTAFMAGPDAWIAGVNVYVIGAPTVGLGLILFSVAQLRGRSVVRFVPGLMIAGILLGAIGLALPTFPWVFVASGMLFGIAFALNGWQTLKGLPPCP